MRLKIKRILGPVTGSLLAAALFSQSLFYHANAKEKCSLFRFSDCVKLPGTVNQNNPHKPLRTMQVESVLTSSGSNY